jgi:hypothetical protein
MPMRARDPGESHRVSTPLELLFDLTFVVGVSAVVPSSPTRSREDIRSRG